MLNITPGYLSEVVSQTFGLSPKAFINQRLLSEAKNLLYYSDSTISEIAYQLGFSDPASFGKFFRKNATISPSEFRKSPKMDESFQSLD